jgi:hypothetical protein
MGWAFAALQHPHPQLMMAIASAAERRVEQLRPLDAARLVWAYAMLGYFPAELLPKLGARAKVPSLKLGIRSGFSGRCSGCSAALRDGEPCSDAPHINERMPVGHVSVVRNRTFGPYSVAVHGELRVRCALACPRHL